ncbi:golgin subfamily A member 4 isoform X1 [Patella vulgata]|uniref:golgin subfamily A member 4 isoform X1 n=1 Tax=Patella vulgata TaxID=6465 RepID=UPI00217F4273|nr:golgin subfamily A member 4 isoform X1 [Patella vulgata]
MAAKCRKFIPNIFNKAKCQTCFGAKEAHSAEALENNKASRKVSKCGYLFVAPDFDFNSPLDRTKRWQRRFFVLYDDAELTFSVDDNVDTIPQGVIDMNKVTDVIDTEKQTSHLYSLGIVTPEKTHYIKGESKEESLWWYDVLIQYPRSLKAIKPRRKPPISNKENVQPSTNSNNRFVIEKVKGKSDLPSFSTYRGVRSLKHKYDKNYQDGLRKSSSLQDISSENKDLGGDLINTKYLSSSGDQINCYRRLDHDYPLGSRQQILSDPKYSNPYFTVPRTLWHHSGRSSSSSSSSVLSTTPVTSTPAPGHSVSSSVRRGSQEENKRSKSVSALERSRIHRERSTSLKDFPTTLSLPRVSLDDTSRSVVSGADNSQPDTPRDDDTESNETDELKMARSSELNSGSRSNINALPKPEQSNTIFEDLVYMKKGWLIKLGKVEKEPKKHWFVLAGNSLHYYKDAKAEDSNNLDGRIDLSTCYEVSEVSLPRNYGFKIKTRNGEYQLAAMTSGIRNNWMKALRLCMDLHNSSAKRKHASSLAGKALMGLTARASDDFEVSGASGGTKAVTNPSGETAFQLVGSRRETKNIRRHHSDVNPGNVSKVLSVSEFSGALDTANLNLSSSTVSNESPGTGTGSSSASDTTEEDRSRSSRIPKHHGSTSSQDSLSWSQSSAPIRRYVEGSDSIPSSSTSSSDHPRRSKHNITIDVKKEEERRDQLRRGKSPSARIKEKSRSTKAPRLHSPPPEEEYSSKYSLPAQGSDDDITQELYHDAMDTTDGRSDQAANMKDGMLVELLETEVESLKESLDHKEEELVKMQEANLDLKNRLQSTSDSQGSLDRYSGSKQLEASQIQSMKRQMKDSKDSVQRQKNEIDNLKSKLDMSVSKLTGTEKALSEALKELKQEKERFLKLTNEWNRRIRTLEGQLKDSSSKLERNKENLVSKERECRRLETEMKGALQKTREYEREILKLKAIENEYQVLKEKFDDKEHDIVTLRNQVRDREAQCKKLEAELEEMEKSNSNEQDALENHIEQLQSKLCAAHQRQTTVTITNNMADILLEKDEIIHKLEEKLSEKDRKIIDMSEELQAEMSENAELISNVDILQGERQELLEKIERLQTVQTKLSKLESENLSLKMIIDQLKRDDKSGSLDQKERNQFNKTIQGLNKQVQELQLQLMEKFEDLDRSLGSSSHLDSQELLHTVLVVDSELKDVNAMLLTLRKKFDAYLDTQQGENLTKLISLADMIEDIGRKCQSVQEVLKEVPQSPPLSPVSQSPEYSHEITVDSKSNPKEIFSEYKGLKNKFDSAVSELKKLRKEMTNIYSNYDKLEKEDTKVKSQLMGLEEAYKSQLESMMKRVETLTTKLDQVKNPAQTNPSKVKPSKTQQHDLFGMSQEVEKLLDELDSKFEEVEKNIAKGTSPPTADQKNKKSRMSVSPDEIIGQLKQMKVQLDHTNVKLKDISEELTPKKSAKPEHGSGTHLQKRLSEYGQKIDTMTNNLEKTSIESDDVGNIGQSDGQEIAFEDCLTEIRERIVEIGEQLDAIEDDSSESESEEDEDETTIDDVREKLSNLLEFVQEHSKLSSFDWKVLDKMTRQHSAIMRSKATKQETVTREDRLKLYADRVSIEAVILGEMATLLQNKYTDTPSNPLFNEMNNLNNLILVLHQQLDLESRHLTFENRVDDVLSSYADILAERIVLESDLCDKQCVASKGQVTMLAMEGLTRSQIDCQINETLNRPLNELESVSSHIVSRALIQGELTCALQKVKKHVNTSIGSSAQQQIQKEYGFQQLKSREGTVLDFCEQYENKMVEALALIVARQADELTIEQGPVSVLEAVCSEISTIMEKHIQSYKQKIRTANETQTAHKFDMIVSRLRSDREMVLNDIKKRHDHYTELLAKDEDIDEPQVLFQSLDNTINSFGEILSKKAIILAISSFVSEMYEAKDLSVYEEDDERDSISSTADVDRGVRFFMRNLSDYLQQESLSKQNIVLELQKSDQLTASSSPDSLIVSLPDLTQYPKHLSPYAENLVREAVFQSQMTYMMLKMRLEHEQELSQHKKMHGKFTRGESEESEVDFNTALAPLEEVLDSKFEDESEVLHMFFQQLEALRQSFNATESPALEEEMQQLEHMLEQEMMAAHERHEVQVEVFKQELSKIEKIWECRENARYECRDRMEDLEEELNYIKSEHEEEVERMKQDVLTAVGAIRANEELSETNLTEKVQNLIHQLASQKRNYKLFLDGIKRKIHSLDKNEILKKIEEQLNNLKRSASQDDDMYSMTSSTSESDLSHTDAVDGGEEIKATDVRPIKLKSSSEKNRKPREAELDKLRKEKEEALAEEMRNTKAALDAMRKAYEVELDEEKDKYKELMSKMYTDDFVAEIRRQHVTEIDRYREEQKQLEMHYSSKTEDYKILEVKMKQLKEDYDAHIRQLLSSNEQLNKLVNQEVDEIKEFIKTKPSRLAPGSATVDEELYDAQIMVRVKDAELQKLRLQVKNHENSIHRMTEEQRQTMTENLRLIKENQELSAEFKRREGETTGRSGKATDDTGGRRPVRRAPSFHQRERSPSPTSTSKKEGEHVSRDGHRRRHLGPRDLKRSKSSPSLPYVFDTKGLPDSKQGREVKTPRSVKAASAAKR